MKRQGFLKGSAILLGMVFITKAIGLAYKIPLTHLLGGSGMAYYSGAFAVFTPLLAAAVSGISASTARLTAENMAFERYTNLRKTRQCAMLLYSAIGLLAALLFIALSEPLAIRFLHDKHAALALAALAPSILFAAVLSVERGYFEGLRNMLPTAFSEIAETVIKAVLGLTGAYAVLNYAETEFSETHGCFGQFFRTAEEARAFALPFAVTAAVLACSLATGFACIYIILKRKLGGDGITPAQLSSDTLTDSCGHISRRLLSFSLPIAGAAVITTLTGTIDLLTISRGLDSALSAGMKTGLNIQTSALPDFIYGSYTGLALMVTGLVPTFTAMFGKSALPSLAEAWSREDSKALSVQTVRMIKLTALIAIPSGLILTVMPEQVLSFLFKGRTEEIASASPALAILGIACIFTSFALPSLTALQALGSRLAPILLMTAGGIIKLAGNLLLIPQPALGIRGAAISTAAAQGFIAVSALLLLFRKTETRSHLSAAILRPAFAALLGTAAARLTVDVSQKVIDVSSESRLLFSISAVFGAFVYVSALWLIGVLPQERISGYFYKKNS
ncbi:MAG: polysaccharide biosynthesis C-terminal domain-containing protein [Ruminococcus sp.]|nr:polysaccharide biosynthesis C-terminal domain-containing protein [Ruminococcus sp.]